MKGELFRVIRGCGVVWPSSLYSKVSLCERLTFDKNQSLIVTDFGTESGYSLFQHHSLWGIEFCQCLVVPND